MRRLIILIVVFTFLNIPCNIEAQANEGNPQVAKYAPDQVLVKFKEGIDPQQVLEKANVEIESIERVHSIKPVVAKFKKDHKLEKDSDGWFWFLEKKYKEEPSEEVFKEAYKKMSSARQGLYRNYKITIPESVSVEEVVANLKNNPYIEYAYPNYIREVNYIPNDTDFGTQWALPRINAPAAWEISEGNSDVLIAIIDTGVDYNHRDFLRDLNENDTPDFGEQYNIWINDHEIPDNNIDDDNNGYIDDVIGYDFVSVSIGEVAAGEDPGPEDNDPMDFNGHGTHCSGIAAAVTNNSIGMAGLASNCRIMAIRAGYQAPNGYAYLEDSDIEQAILYAVDNGARVISMSFGAYARGAWEDELGVAHDDDIILVAAAGNEDTDEELYPAAMHEVIAVAATDQNDDRSVWQHPFASNYGTWVDVAAPGTSIFSTIPGNEYSSWGGTSMACPHVAALAGLIASEEPQLTNEEVRYIIEASSDDIGDPGKDIYFGYGRINASNACNMTTIPNLLGIQLIQAEIADNPPAGDGDGVADPGETLSLQITLKGLISDAHNVNVILDKANADDTFFTVTNDRYSFEAISRNEEKNNSDDLFEFAVNPNCPPGVVLRLVLHITTVDFSRSYHLEFEVSNPHWKDIGNPGTKAPVYGDIDPLYPGLETVLLVPVMVDLVQERTDIYIYHEDGTALNGWDPKEIQGEMTHSAAPALGDIDNDGELEIIVAASGNKVFAFNANGSLVNDQQWPKVLGDTVTAAPVLADLDNNGTKEILVNAKDGYLYIWQHDGSDFNVAWPKLLDGALTVSPAVANLDSDPELEIITSSGDSGSKVYIFNIDGSSINENWPQNIESGYKAQNPVIGDIDTDGELEIVVGALFHLDVAGKIYAWNIDGSSVNGSWPHDISGDEFVAAYPMYLVLADLDRQYPGLEIITAPNYSNKVYAWHHDGSAVSGWPYIGDEVLYIGNPPTVGDVDGDGQIEVIVTAGAQSLDGSKCAYIINHDGTDISGYPMYLPKGAQVSSALGNIRMTDSSVRLIQPTADGKIYAWDFSTAPYSAKIEWPMLQGNAAHTGSYTSSPTTLLTADLNGNGLGDIVVDYGTGSGIWVGYDNGVWENIYNESANSTVIADLNGDGKDEIIFDFGPSKNYIWVKYETYWENIYGIPTEQMVTVDTTEDGRKDTLIVDFGEPHGLYLLNNTTGVWENICGLDPINIIVGDLDGNNLDDLIIDFGEAHNYVWVRFDNGSWGDIYGISPDFMITAELDQDDKADLILDFGPTRNGLWILYGNGSLANLYPTSPDSITVGKLNANDTDELIMDLGPSKGLWVSYDNNPSASFPNIHGLCPVSITTGDLNNNGQDEVIAYFGPAKGIWVYYDGTTWEYLHKE